MLETLKKATHDALAAIREEMAVRKTKEVFLLFSLGSQFDHLIQQELAKLGVFSLVADPASVTADDIEKLKPAGIILSGGPASVYEAPPPFDGRIFDLGIPVLGICLGFQLWAKHIGAEVRPADKREFSTHTLAAKGAKLFVGCRSEMKVLQSHGDVIVPNGKIEIIGTTENCPVAAGAYRHLWGVQFHPEVTETEHGGRIFKNFCFDICGAKDIYPAGKEAERKIEALRKEVGNKKILLALSGGSDSSVAAHLLRYAVGGKKDRIHAVYIRGIDRPDDEQFVRDFFGHENWLSLEIVDATDEFLGCLKGKLTMKEKRVAMRGVYKAILEQKAAQFGADFIAQGTLYTDVSESGGGYDAGAKKAVIKLHHNVNLGFSLKELTPLIDCVKDSGRNIGRAIGVPEVLLSRHPFPGPGLVVRVESEITADKLRIAREADRIYIEELRKHDLYKSIWQAGATVTQSVTTCTKGDDASNGIVLALWAVWSVNGFTARAAELPYEFLKKVSRRITNEIREVGSVVYRVSDKPPTTIEWG